MKRTLVSTAAAEGLRRRDQADGSVDPVIAPRQEPQALRSFVEQFGLWQDAPADGDHGVGGEDIGALELVIEPHGFERRLGLGAGEPIGAGTRQLAALRSLIELGRTQRVGLDTDLIDEGDPAG